MVKKFIKYIYWILIGRKKFNRKFQHIRVAKDVIIQFDFPIGDYTFIGTHTQIGPNCKSIGRYCSIARRVSLGPNNHPKSMLSTSSVFYSENWDYAENPNHNRYNKQSVVIENDVWIGINAIVIGDVTIGNGAIVAANAVVTKDVPPYAIVGGVPAKIIGYRFDTETINELLASKWWELDIEETKSLYDQFAKGKK